MSFMRVLGFLFGIAAAACAHQTPRSSGEAGPGAPENAAAEDADLYVETDVSYAKEHGIHGKLDIVAPRDAKARPIVMVVHGGGMISGNKERMHGVALFLARRGWVAVNVNYRLLPDVPFPEPLRDVLAAFKWIKETTHPILARQDRTRLALLGASAGGYLVLSAGFILGGAEVKAIIDISGPSGDRYSVKYPPDEQDPRLSKTPMQLANAAAPVLLAVHSRVDGVVDHGDSEKVVAAVKDAGGTADLYSFEGPDRLHGIWQVQDAKTPRLLSHIEDRIVTFLEQNLKTCGCRVLPQKNL